MQRVHGLRGSGQGAVASGNLHCFPCLGPQGARTLQQGGALECGCDNDWTSKVSKDCVPHLTKHGMCHVDAEDAASGSHCMRCQYGRQPSAGGDIQHSLARLYVGLAHEGLCQALVV